MTIDPRYLVPGDIVEIKEGDFIPADIILFETREMIVNNSIITGEIEEKIRKLFIE